MTVEQVFVVAVALLSLGYLVMAGLTLYACQDHDMPGVRPTIWASIAIAILFLMVAAIAYPCLELKWPLSLFGSAG